jgi:serine phosphatase RsbU (regulator of sigma subunit)
MVRTYLSSLRVRLILLILIAVLPALGLILHTASEQRRLATAQAQEDALRLARLMSASQEQAIEGARQLLVALAQMPSVREGDSAACSELFADFLKQYPRYTNFGVAGADGDVICSALPPGGLVNIADRSYFQRAWNTRDFAIGDYQIGRISQRATVAFGYPVLDEAGRTEAVVFAGLELAWLNQVAAEAQLPAGSILTVVDRNGTVLARYPDPDAWVGKTVPEAPIVATILSEPGEATAEAPALDGTPYLFGFTPLGGASQADGVRLSIGIPRELALAQADRTLAQNLTGLGLVAALALAAAWIGSEAFILRQVRALVAATRRLSTGDLGARTGLSDGPGELSQLARAFDDMAESLQQQHEQRLVEEQVRLQLAALLGELARAAEVQATLLPRDVPVVPGFELAARCIPARDVGGDFYDWQQPAPGILPLTLGDVMGKGMPAALLMATVRAALRAVAAEHGPAAAVELTGRALAIDLERSESFVTLFHAQLDAPARRLIYVDAGHGHVFVRRAAGTVEVLRPRRPPLGVLAGDGYLEGELAFGAGDALILYSDGLIDARPELALDRSTLADYLTVTMSAQEMVDRLLEVAAPPGLPPDDLTIVVLRCTGK